jgi:hypothetical protein
MSPQTKKILCDICNSTLLVEDVIDCACGLPFCDGCYEDHCQECPEALEDMGVDEMEEEDEDVGYLP